MLKIDLQRVRITFNISREILSKADGLFIVCHNRLALASGSRVSSALFTISIHDIFTPLTCSLPPRVACWDISRFSDIENVILRIENEKFWQIISCVCRETRPIFYFPWHPPSTITLNVKTTEDESVKRWKILFLRKISKNSGMSITNSGSFL